MFTCEKVYADVPFAHRQHLHAGHCRFVHGHNWTFRIRFGCERLDATGFVVDFGDLKQLRQWLTDNFDHACVFNRADPLLPVLTATAPEAWKVVVVDNCSCEGLAQHVAEHFDSLVRERTAGRAWVVSVEVEEDSKNSATYCLPR